MAELNEALDRAMLEATEVFSKLGTVVEAAVEEAQANGTTALNVAEIVQRAGLAVDEVTLDQMQVDRIVFALPWTHWGFWFPWRPLWCWWWRRFYPWYCCCPWWWHRCHCGKC